MSPGNMAGRHQPRLQLKALLVYQREAGGAPRNAISISSSSQFDAVLARTALSGGGAHLTEGVIRPARMTVHINSTELQNKLVQFAVQVSHSKTLRLNNKIPKVGIKMIFAGNSHVN